MFQKPKSGEKNIQTHEKQEGHYSNAKADEKMNPSGKDAAIFSEEEACGSKVLKGKRKSVQTRLGALTSSFAHRREIPWKAEVHVYAC